MERVVDLWGAVVEWVIPVESNIWKCPFFIDDYAQNYDYEPIEIMEIGYDDYLVFELDGVMKGRNIHTSEIFMP